MNHKRKPTVADMVLNIGRSYDMESLTAFRSNLMLAKRFVLDEQAACYVAEMIRDIPRVIADAMDFAIPPFHRTWIEFPTSKFWEIIHGKEINYTHETYTGFLIVGNMVYIAMHDEENKDTAISPVSYHLNHPMSIEEQWDLCRILQTTRLQLDDYFWGISAKSLDTKEGRRALRENHGMIVSSKIPEKHLHRLQRLTSGKAGGDLRNIIAMLLFLNRTRDQQIQTERPMKQGFIGNKLRPFLKHTVIRMSLNPAPRLLNLVPGDGVWRRLHDVRGHFCHNRRARESGCMHGEWEEYEPLRWKCPKCGGLRWWRHEHKRGHEEKGEVTSEYLVTANNERNKK